MSVFVDRAQLHARGGDGGAGAVSTRREAHVPRGGPDGGDGGAGGDVWLVADHNVASLLAFRDHPHRAAGSGTHGAGKKRHGKAGGDLEVAVPPGTTVRTAEGELLADLTTSGDRWAAAHGGQGGRGNARFLSNRRRAPSFAEQGEEGEERWLELELRLLADVALVGFPNVGKSTLISRISAARPRIADYPFTTLEPNLGVVRVEEGRELVVADIPGLIEGASEGRGLGHQFLRHVERARVLAVLVDLSPLAPHPPAEQERILLDELGSYRPDLLTRPRVVVGSRSDLAPPEALARPAAGSTGGADEAADADPTLTGRSPAVATDTGAAPADRSAAADGLDRDRSGGSVAGPVVPRSRPAPADGAAQGPVRATSAGPVADEEPSSATPIGSAGRVARAQSRSPGPSPAGASDAEDPAVGGGPAPSGPGEAGPDVRPRGALDGGGGAPAPDPATATGQCDHVISAVTGAGLGPLVGHLAALVDGVRTEEPRTEGFVVHRPAPSGVSVARDEDGALRVHGRAAERAVALSDVSSPDAQAYVRDRLERLGVTKALVRAGARSGDEVRIGTFSFDYIPDDQSG